MCNTTKSDSSIRGGGGACTKEYQHQANAHERIPRRIERASLRLTPADVLVQRVGLRQSLPAPIARRGKITAWSRRSRQNLKLALRGVEGLDRLVTLTYGAEFPTDNAVVKNHWERIRKWFTRHGFKGVWRREVQRRGALHYHVLVGGDAELDVTELARAWAHITKNDDPAHSVHVSPIRSQEKVATYLSKMDWLSDESASLGRYWGTFGGATVAIKAEIIGDAASVAKIARVARHLERVQRGGANLRPRRDNGQWGCVVWGVAKVLSASLPRLITLYGLTNHVTATFAASGQAADIAASQCRRPVVETNTGAFGRAGWNTLRRQVSVY